MVNVVSGHTFAICIKNEDYEVSLELRKLYEVLPDSKSEQLGMVRVVDESGEDYLYPQAFFVRISLPETVEEQVSVHAICSGLQSLDCPNANLTETGLCAKP
jgi:hypothetical protein